MIPLHCPLYLVVGGASPNRSFSSGIRPGPLHLLVILYDVGTILQWSWPRQGHQSVDTNSIHNVIRRSNRCRRRNALILLTNTATAKPHLCTYILTNVELEELERLINRYLFLGYILPMYGIPGFRIQSLLFWYHSLNSNPCIGVVLTSLLIVNGGGPGERLPKIVQTTFLSNRIN